MNQRQDNPYRYDDIITLPHHVSEKHPPMSLRDRAAQFAPFKALTGYEDDVAETARLTDERIELDENRKAVLDARLQQIEDCLDDTPAVSITFFQPDARKSGGVYRTIQSTVKRIDTFDRVVCLSSGERIGIDDIYDIDSDCLDGGLLK